jgi:hypothetical protein
VATTWRRRTGCLHFMVSLCEEGAAATRKGGLTEHVLQQRRRGLRWRRARSAPSSKDLLHKREKLRGRVGSRNDGRGETEVVGSDGTTSARRNSLTGRQQWLHGCFIDDIGDYWATGTRMEARADNVLWAGTFVRGKIVN